MATSLAPRWLLDTDIVSELARPNPSVHVLTAFAAQADVSALPMIVWHELLVGGRPLAEPDAQIAATALAQGLTLVTRNTRGFTGIAGLKLANWFNG